MGPKKAKAILEAIIFASAAPVPVANLASVIGWEPAQTELLLAELAREYQCAGRGIQLSFVAGGYELTTKQEMKPYLQAFQRPEISIGLSQAALETLAIIAYKQPVTKIEIEDIRGVRADSAVNTLLERGLIEERGRQDTPGRPILLGTSPKFLECFGLATLADLPPLPKIRESSRQSINDIS
ncbi:MAG: SMC-Scp complex subunit ScpB [Firmicutes bacterium]|nr:SMC-Scp complex subunit ScpB [Bacillota bacterium]